MEEEARRRLGRVFFKLVFIVSSWLFLFCSVYIRGAVFSHCSRCFLFFSFLFFCIFKPSPLVDVFGVLSWMSGWKTVE